MLEPSFLANALSYTYYGCTLPFDWLLLPIYK